MAIVKKQIKFDLSINGIKVKSLDDLRENITIEVIDLLKSGILVKWLKQLKEDQILEALMQVNQCQDDKILFIDIITTLGEIEFDDQIVDELFKIPVKTNSTIDEAKKEMKNIDIQEFTLDANDQRILGDYWKKVDKERSFYWYRRSAENGDALAQCELGLMYYNGESVTVDKEQAFHWYKESAEQGNAEAQYQLGNMYRCGEFVEEDKEQALYWFKKSEDQGHFYARINAIHLDGELQTANLLNNFI